MASLEALFLHVEFIGTLALFSASERKAVESMEKL